MDEDQEQRFAQAERLRQGYRKSGRRRVVVGFVALLLVLGGIGAFAAYKVSKDRGPDAPEHATAGFGFTLTAAELAPEGKEPAAKENPVEVEIWDEFFCPECRRFNRDVSGYLRQAVRRGDIELTLHPVVLRDDGSTNNYAERAANAAACVADDAGLQAYADMHDLLVRRQPAQGKPGASTATLVSWAKSVGADDVEDCIEERTFLPWLEAASPAAKEDGVSEAPTVLVAGREIVSPGKDGAVVMPDRKELRFAIESVTP